MLRRVPGCGSIAARAPGIDRAARFPTENYADLHANDLMGICIPKHYGGRGADLRAYMLAAAEIGRYCGATALTFNMHVSSCLWTGFLADNLPMSADQRTSHDATCHRHYHHPRGGAIYAQPFSEGGDAAAGKTAFGTTALIADGGWIINGKKIFASLSGHADYYGVLCTELATADATPSRANTMYIAIDSRAAAGFRLKVSGIRLVCGEPSLALWFSRMSLFPLKNN